jgi:hypothetical protein
MTPRKELFIKIQEALKNGVQELELVDLQRKQFSNPKENYPSYWTSALIDIKTIRWESMVENKQEGECTVDVTLYCKDGWLDQHDGTADANGGLTEIDLIDAMVESLQFLKGDYFKPLELSNESSEDVDSEIMSYTLSFTTLIYRRVNPRYSNRTITINP